MERAQRAAVHRALGDEVRLQIIDELALSDRTPQELARITGSETNLLAHHLGVLAEAGLVRRRVSSGDRRRRYISLETGMVRSLLPKLAAEGRLRRVRVHTQLCPLPVRRGPA